MFKEERRHIDNKNKTHTRSRPIYDPDIGAGRQELWLKYQKLRNIWGKKSIKIYNFSKIEIYTNNKMESP